MATEMRVLCLKQEAHQPWTTLVYNHLWNIEEKFFFDTADLNSFLLKHFAENCPNAKTRGAQEYWTSS
jgi:hypothetical protein